MKLLIRELREEFAMTQKELAGKIGTLQRNVSNWENGVSEPDCETIVKLAELFKVTLDELFGREAFGETGKYSGADRQLINAVVRLSETQKFTLLQFLREMTV